MQAIMIGRVFGTIFAVRYDVRIRCDTRILCVESSLNNDPKSMNSKAIREKHDRLLRKAILGDLTDSEPLVQPGEIRYPGMPGPSSPHNESPGSSMNQNDAHQNDKVRVLILAEACNPKWSSVPLVGFNQIRALAERPDLEITLATHVRNRESLAGDPIMDKIKTVAFIDSDLIARPMYRLGQLLRGGKTLGWTTNMALAWPGYFLFERLVWKRFRTAIQAGQFDVIHRVTPVSPTLPSPIASWSPIPFVVGPLNGGLAWPDEYPELKKGEREWLIPLRKAYRLLPWHRRMRRKSAAVIAGSRSTAAELTDVPADRLEYLPENGFDFRLLESANVERTTKPAGPNRLDLISVARLVPY